VRRAVRHPRRDHRYIPGAHGPELPVEFELELSLEYDHDLLLLMDMGRSNRVGRERHEVGHRPLAEDRPELQPRDELDGVDVTHGHEPPGPRRHPAGLAGEMGYTARAGH
jgi:hypothetical protein